MSHCCSPWIRSRFRRPGTNRKRWDVFEALCRAGAMAALLIEPLVLGAGGMRMYGAGVLGELWRIAQRHGVKLIADEVMTGWGRTGTLFACEQAGVTPDILCVSKGLTGGSLPLAATLASAEIFDAFLSDDRKPDVFPFQLLHGEPDRLRGGAGQSGGLGARAGARAHRRTGTHAGGAVIRFPRRFPIRECAPERHRRGARPQGRASRLSVRRGGRACAPFSASATCSSARSAM